MLCEQRPRPLMTPAETKLQRPQLFVAPVVVIVLLAHGYLLLGCPSACDRPWLC